MTEYELAEQRGRDKTEQLLGKKMKMEFTDLYERVDVYATGQTNNDTYVIEIKNYDSTQFPRAYSKFIKDGVDCGYMLDYGKVSELVRIADEEGRIPLLISYFDDCTIIWDIRKTSWDKDKDDRIHKEWRWVNKDGQHYGEKEYAYMTYLYKDEAIWVRQNKK